MRNGTHMYETIFDYFMTKPGRLVGSGRFAARSGMLLLFIGLCGRVATTGVAVLSSRASNTPQAMTLVDVYPALPTWWVPETAFGFLLCLGMIACGVAVAQTGRRLQRYLDH